jgi:protein gp37
MSEKYWAKPVKWDAAAANGKVGKDGKHWIVFGGDMCDVFDSRGLESERLRMWDLTKKTPHLTWLLLTKRPQNFNKFLPADWGNGYTNVWLGVTVDDRAHGYPRVDILRKTPATVRFLSCEPLLEDVGNIDLTGIDWVIAGGESGAGSRSFDLEWARKLRSCCAKTHVAFFFKQLGSKPMEGDSPFQILNNQSSGKRDLHGKSPANFPSDLQVQEWPDQDEPPSPKPDGLPVHAYTQVLQWVHEYAEDPDAGVLSHLAQSAYASLTGMLQVLSGVCDQRRSNQLHR